MLKKLIAIVLVFVFFVSVLWFTSPFESTIIASADTFKNGFFISPQKEDAAGVDLDSGFILDTESKFTLDYLKDSVSFRSGEMFTLTNLSDDKSDSGNSFMIKTAEPLIQNKVYFIDVKTPIGNTITFAFQTRRDFTVLGSLPRNESSYVPLDTGIELYFSYPDVENIEQHFEITPKVEGRFETNGYTSVFIPKQLKAGTLYTITIKNGLTAAGGDIKLTEDYSFSFETSADEKSTADPYKGSLHINNSWLEFATSETPIIPFDIYLRESIDSADVSINVYKFASADHFVKSIRKTDEVPHWAAYTSSKNRIDSSKLDKIMNFKQSFDLKNYQAKYMNFPHALDHGYYLVELSYNELLSQAFMQVSDIASYTISDEGTTLFWLNDINTKKPVKTAEVFDYELGKGFRTNPSGLVELPNSTKYDENDNEVLKLFRITTTDGKVSIINNGYPNMYNPGNNSGLNWQYIQTDRTLYKPDDTVEFWGYIKSRLDGSWPNKVTVELAKGGYYHMPSPIMGYFFPSLSNALETVTLDVNGGFYEGSIHLPNLEQGSYSITIKDGDKILSSNSFTVENYIKPQYKVEVSSDKNAVFVGEEITFTIKASFFDGTPVSNVSLKYYLYDYRSNEQGQGVTDKDGLLTITHTPAYQTGMQGEIGSSINVSAEFPETGNINQYYSYRTFANDITISSKSKTKDGRVVIDYSLNNVDLTTLNDDNPDNNDYVGHPVSGKKLNFSLVHTTWEKTEIGDEYDYINKVVRKTYKYTEKKTTVDTAILTTKEDGSAQYTFDADKYTDGYYMAYVNVEDGNNRPYNHSTSISRTDSSYGYNKGNDSYAMKSDKDKYKDGEKVNVQVYKNDEETLENMPSLFVIARNGIQDYQVNNQPKHSMDFPKGYSPNYSIRGIVFTGKSYISTTSNIIYDYDSKNINLDISTDKDSYKPGDNMTIKIVATDVDGQRVSGKVNISMVDEALLKLSGQYIDPLTRLYSWIGNGILDYRSNRDAVGRGIFRLDGGGVDDALTDNFNTESIADKAPAAAPSAQADVEETSVNVRSEFKDTALFKTVSLDADGVCEYTFRLPDNITSFSLAAAAISNDLQAGSKVESTKVSMPFFINDALSLDYLVGDKPYVGLTAYGDGLNSEEIIEFELTIKELPNYKEVAKAKAFKRVNIALPPLLEGDYTLVMAAESKTGKKDALSRTITVHPSYRTIEMSTLSSVTSGMNLPGGKNGLTTLIFSDKEKAQLINSLHSLAWNDGNRLDQKLVSNQAKVLLETLVNNKQYRLNKTKVDASQYKSEDGGYGILPYAQSDINYTALITPLLNDIMETSALKMYLYNAVVSEDNVQAAALFALAHLGEPVLLDLNRAAQIENLSLEEYIYLGMGFEAIGHIEKATEIYQKKVIPELEYKDPYIRVKVRRNDMDTTLKQTALTAVFASSIDHADAPQLFNYVENNYSKKVYIGVEKILYLCNMSQKLDTTDASFEYSFAGKQHKVDLSHGQSEYLDIPSSKINTFRIINTKGDVSALSLFTGSYTENIQNDSGLTLTRKYYDAATGQEKTTFKSNDLVKVVITYTIDKTAIDNTYEISDYAPAGLKPLDNPWSYGIKNTLGCWYRQFDGQKVSFVVGKYDKANHPKPLVYYARVASPGQYTAEGTVAQGSIVKSSIVTIDDTRIIIEP